MTINIIAVNVLLFNEFISSVDFPELLKQAQNLFNPHYGLGYYLQGIPNRVGVDYFWGTSSGIRIVPFLVWLSFLQKIFGNNWELGYLIICLISTPVGFLIACSLKKRIDLWTIVGAIFYSSNQWVIGKYVTGTWQQILAYAMLPIITILPETVTAKTFWRFSAVFSLLISWVIVANPIYLMFPALYLVLMLINKWRDKITFAQFVNFYLVSGLLILLINTYFVLPSLVYPEISTSHYPGYGLGAIKFNSQHSSFLNVLKFDVWSNGQNSELFLSEIAKFLPMAVTALIFLREKRKKWIFMMCLVFFVFTAKALHPPFSSISKWMYSNIIILNYSRDTSRFLAAVALFMALTMAFNTDVFKKTYLKVIGIILFGVIMIFANYRFISEYPINKYVKTSIPDEYLRLEKFVRYNLNSTERLVSIPNNLTITDYSWYQGFKPTSPRTIYDGVLPLKVELVNSSHYPDNYANQVSAFLTKLYLNSGDSRYLQPLGVNYLLIDNNFSNLHLPFKSSDKMMFKSENLKLFELSSEPISKNINFEAPFFVIGDFNSVAKKYATGKSNPVVLVNQPPNIEHIFSGILNSVQWENDVENPVLTLTGEYLAKKYDLNLFDAISDYDKVFIPYEPYFMTEVEEKGWLFTNPKPVVSIGKGKIVIYKRIQPGKYRILLKGVSRTQASSMTLTIGKVQKDIYLSDNNKLKWTDLGTIEINSKIGKLELMSNSQFSSGVDHLSLVPEKVMVEISDKIKTQMEKPRTIDNLTYLNYLYSYGDHWRAKNSDDKLISNGYAMTFVGSNGQIEIPNYYPEHLYRISLNISLSATLILTLLIAVDSIKNLFLKQTSPVHSNLETER